MLMNLPARPRSRNTTMPETFANKVSSLPRPTFSPGLKCVPRCRTRMEPPVTSSPPKAFTPRRCALESRSFLELPRPFLCAISHLSESLVHRDLREVLRVADGSLVLFLALELEDDHFVAAPVTGNRALHAGFTQSGAGDQFIRVVHHGQHAAERDLRANVARERFHLDHVARSNAVLLSAGFNHCIHNCPRLSLKCGLIRQTLQGCRTS